MSILNWISVVIDQVADWTQPPGFSIWPSTKSHHLSVDHYFGHLGGGQGCSPTTVTRDLSEWWVSTIFFLKSTRGKKKGREEEGCGISVGDRCCNWRKDGWKRHWVSMADHKSESRAVRRTAEGGHSSDRTLNKGKPGRPTWCLLYPYTVPSLCVCWLACEFDLRGHLSQSCQSFKDAVTN